MKPKASCVVHIVPTSIGASIGGFAGDASPVTNLLAHVSDSVITHPNVLNASDILSISPNTYYVEGSLLDAFFLGQIALRPVNSNKLGIIIEKQPQKYIDYVRYSIDAAHATCGIPIIGYSVTKDKIAPTVHRFESGAYSGTINNIEVLLEAAEKLVSEGATAIAITSEILGLPDLTNYIRGLEPNPHGGVEALISHTVSQFFKVPSAHAPMWGEHAPKNEFIPTDYDPREAAELVTTTALNCVLQGLSKAPCPIMIQDAISTDITVSDVIALVTPHNSVGHIPALASSKLGIPIIGVADNKTIQKTNHRHLNLKCYYKIQNYLEAAGLVTALRVGIPIGSLRRPINHIKRL